MARIVHIGYAKSGTTFLQHKVFPGLKGIEYVRKESSKRMLYPLILNAHRDLDFEQIAKGIQSNIGDHALLSEEQLTGSFFVNLAINRYDIAEGLKSLGMDKVIITIRNQRDAVPSLYSQYVHEGGVLKMKDFLSVDGAFQSFNPRFNAAYLHYDRLIEVYQELFGKENVLVLLNEELRKDMAGCISTIESFCNATFDQSLIKGSRDNKSLDRVSLGVQRVLNRYTWNRFSPATRIIPGLTSTRLRRILQGTIGKLFSSAGRINAGSEHEALIASYRSSNKRLAALIDKDLGAFDYPM